MSQLIQELAKGQEESVTQTLAAQISAQRTKRGLSVISVDLATELFSTAVVAVHVDMHGRGNPQDRALLYGCRSNDDIVSWRAAVDHNEVCSQLSKENSSSHSA
jgi:hypothetical protein